MGKGFAFVARQQRISTETQDFYIDLVFYSSVGRVSDSVTRQFWLIKTTFTKKYPDPFIVQNINRKNKKQQEIWQHRGWEHCLRYQQDFQKHIDYIHYNPVKHGLVKRASDWQYSSIHRYIKLNILDNNWGDGEIAFADDIGYE
ncbi:MAG: PDDEXK nuclease domain-containing protein [Methylococcales bacterium]|nr:PDDEXK nuclease domain-containing protein [Methylococcales bacterium]